MINFGAFVGQARPLPTKPLPPISPPHCLEQLPTESDPFMVDRVHFPVHGHDHKELPLRPDRKDKLRPLPTQDLDLNLHTECPLRLGKLRNFQEFVYATRLKVDF